ncbi:MAG: hypothetical protein LBE38_08030 [Deltaproteobacteria bacterium]|jgi:hypothetical protein|nr:hypothetical protein [Deltaproteobacteria bacterium]
MDVVKYIKDYVKLLDKPHKPLQYFLMIQRFDLDPDFPPSAIAMDFVHYNLQDNVTMFDLAEAFLVSQEALGYSPLIFKIWYVNKYDLYYQLIKDVGVREINRDAPRIKVNAALWTPVPEYEPEHPYESLHPDSPSKIEREMWSDNWSKKRKALRKKLDKQLKIVDSNKED